MGKISADEIPAALKWRKSTDEAFDDGHEYVRVVRGKHKHKQN